MAPVKICIRRTKILFNSIFPTIKTATTIISPIMPQDNKSLN